MPKVRENILGREERMYGKYFASTYTGSMIGAGLNVFAVWGYIIANTVKSRVEINPRLLAMVLGCKEEEILQAIEYLEKPDPRSRSKEYDGRRIIREGEYQYFIPTFDTYRKILNEDERREYNRLKQAEHRRKIKEIGIDKRRSINVKERVNDLRGMSAHTEAEAISIYKEKQTYVDLAVFLENSIKENIPYHKFKGKDYINAWARQFRLMEEADKIPFDKIKPVLEWSQKDDFWKINILSAGNFRDKFGRLEAKMNGKKPEDQEARRKAEREAWLKEPEKGESND